ncbi:hypothetical protein T265_05896 [Opisthorchis viverrini]|uniref:tRNA dimethylallyltransferase n=1 Tax=Opisthorchis viverrini TaxID=6198 RepID=A0A074ZJ23_OPIVI|nr:hypothetical protein T265_05896 [Opisthorchis viverrini]KER26991.1 hypothetical protein T265_05896 [Opisthorchis viverrini]
MEYHQQMHCSEGGFEHRTTLSGHKQSRLVTATPEWRNRSTGIMEQLRSHSVKARECWFVTTVVLLAFQDGDPVLLTVPGWRHYKIWLPTDVNGALVASSHFYREPSGSNVTLMIAYTSSGLLFMVLELTGSGRGLLRSLMNLSTCILNPTPPVIAIGGPTGTGKSKLAISLASIFRGEVVNADAVQLYEGLTIATNKVSESEAAGVPHHLIGCFPPAFAYCADVHKYKAVCLPTIDKIRLENQRIPFLVGGTHYYMEAILWSDFLTSTDKPDSDDLDSCNTLADMSPEASTTAEIPSGHSNLDGGRASWLRWLEREFTDRKIRGSNPTSASGLPLSRLGQPGGIPALVLPSGSMAARHQKNMSRWFKWLERESTNWKVRVSGPTCASRLPLSRLGQPASIPALVLPSGGMAARHRKGCTRAGILPGCPNLDRESGQAEVGFEPRTFRSVVRTRPLPHLDFPCLSFDNLAVSQPSCLLLVARQLGTERVKWIVNRFLKRPQFGSIPVYRLDTTPTLHSTSPDSWDHHILAPACRIFYEHMVKVGNWTDQFVSDFERFRTLLGYCPSSDCPKQCDFKPLLKEELASPLICTACDNRVFVRLADFEAHRRSRSHQKRVSKLRRREQMQSFLFLARWTKWLEREFADRKVRGSNPTSESRLSLSRLGQPGSIPALVLSLSGMAKKAFSCSTLSTRGCHATQRKYEAWDTARLPKPRQGELRGSGRVRTTDLRALTHEPSRRLSCDGCWVTRGVQSEAVESDGNASPTWILNFRFIQTTHQSKATMVIVADLTGPQKGVRDGANLLTGKSVVRTQPSPLDLSCLGLSNLAVSQPSYFLRVACQLGNEKVLQSND